MMHRNCHQWPVHQLRCMRRPRCRLHRRCWKVAGGRLRCRAVGECEQRGPWGFLALSRFSVCPWAVQGTSLGHRERIGRRLARWSQAHWSQELEMGGYRPGREPGYCWLEPEQACCLLPDPGLGWVCSSCGRGRSQRHHY